MGKGQAGEGGCQPEPVVPSPGAGFQPSSSVFLIVLEVLPENPLFSGQTLPIQLPLGNRRQRFPVWGGRGVSTLTLGKRRWSLFVCLFVGFTPLFFTPDKVRVPHLLSVFVST